MDDDAAPDLSNWRKAPFSRRAFVNVAAMMPVDTLGKGGGEARALPPSARTLDGFSVTGLDGTAHDMAAFLEATATDAMIVLKDGEVVFETYHKGVPANAPHIIMSATKSVVGLTASLLAHGGGLDLDAPVTLYVPEVAGSLYADATLRHLIDMRVAHALMPEQQHAYNLATGWEPRSGEEGEDGLTGFFTALKGPPAAVGTPFHYVSANLDLMGWVLERALGRKVSALIADLLWSRFGAGVDGKITLAPDGLARCTGGVCTTVRDLARLGAMIADGGRYGGQEIAPAAILDDLEQGGDRAAWLEGDWGAMFARFLPPMSYRAGWYTIHREAADLGGPLLFAMGIHGQNLFIDRARRIVVAKLSSWAEPTDFHALPLTHRAVDEIVRRLA